MLYSEFKTKTIKLINTFSTSGNLTPLADNQDNLLRFPDFADTSQKEIATTAKYIHALITFNQDPVTTPPTADYTEYTLPANYCNMHKVEMNNSKVSWEFTGRKKIAVRSNLTGIINVFYHAYPATIPSNVADSYEFEVDEEAAQAIPYYVAAQVLMDDPVNKSVSDKLMAIYQGKLANMKNVNTQGNTTVKNTMFTIS